eukprot:GHVP01011134.1.p1 GENE.GHVP01011134.1~~GHVP01011134.1.p1  ORF type:complete len:592 (+),score=130.18 GHVP01011134.1:2350-4125(+)
MDSSSKNMYMKKDGADENGMIRRMEKLDLNNSLTGERIAKSMEPQYSSIINTKLDDKAPFQETSATIYVGNLSKEVTEKELYELFEEMGKVLSLKLIVDPSSERKTGHAYITYTNEADAEGAIHKLQYFNLKGRECRVMWSQRDPTKRLSHEGNVFLKGLSDDITTKDLNDTLEVFGEIHSASVAFDEKGKSKGYGFVHFTTKSAAETAVKSLNGNYINNTQIYAALHIPRYIRRRFLDEMRERYTNLYVKGFDESWTDEKLLEVFSPFGEIQNAQIQRTTDGKSLCFGFVNYKEHASTKEALETLNGTEPHNLFVTRAMTKIERAEHLRQQYNRIKQEMIDKYEGQNLYVKNIDLGMTDEEFKALFEKYGETTSTRIMKTDVGMSRGFGFVCYTSAVSAENAIKAENGRVISKKPLYVGYAEKKEDRHRKLADEYRRRSQEVGYEESLYNEKSSMDRSYSKYDTRKPLYRPSRAGTNKREDVYRKKYTRHESNSDEKSDAIKQKKELSFEAPSEGLSLEKLAKLTDEEKTKYIAKVLRSKLQQKHGSIITEKMIDKLINLSVDEILDMIEAPETMDKYCEDIINEEEGKL